jgi:hypothetical protein
MTQSRRKNLLWLDDDFVEDIDRLSVWVNYLEFKRSNQFVLLKAQSVADFSKFLKERSSHTADHAYYIDCILLDVRLRPLPDATFKDLGFDDKHLPLDAGAQILGLMQNPSRAATRPDWLKPYVNRPTALLTSATEVQELWQKHVNPAVREKTTVLIKQDSIDELSQDPHESFKQFLDAVSNQTIEGRST